MMDWLVWLGRGAEKERAYKRLAALQEQYGSHGERVIQLSERTDRARQSAGSTKQAFEFVEKAFVKATQEYARIGELLTALEAGLAKGKVGDMVAIEKGLQGVGAALDELDRSLATWEETWRAGPRKIEEAALRLAELRQRVDLASAQLGAPLPLADQVVGLEQHLEKIRRTLSEGNPIEAANQVEDLQLAQRRVEEQVSTYVSGTGAIEQAAQELAEVQQRLAGRTDGPAEAIGAVAAAEALLPRLRPALAAGKLGPFQQDLLQLQRHLSTARSALK